MDAFIPFRPLTHDSGEEAFALFVERHVNHVAERMMTEYDLRLSWSPEVLITLVKECRSTQVSGIAEVVHEQVVHPITELLLDGRASQGAAVQIEVVAGKLTFSPPD